jgi:hypothetical protein
MFHQLQIAPETGTKTSTHMSLRDSQDPNYGSPVLSPPVQKNRVLLKMHNKINVFFMDANNIHSSA